MPGLETSRRQDASESVEPGNARGEAGRIRALNTRSLSAEERCDSGATSWRNAPEATCEPAVAGRGGRRSLRRDVGRSLSEEALSFLLQVAHGDVRERTQHDVGVTESSRLRIPKGRERRSPSCRLVRDFDAEQESSRARQWSAKYRTVEPR